MDELITPIFKITSSTPYDKKSKFYRMECPSWINILPITKDNQVILVKQYRYGTDSETLELPAGKMETTDKDPIETAKRELLEETGYGNGEWQSLGWVHPNPAIQNNRCYNFLAKNVEKIAEINNDEHEKTEPIFIPISKIDDFILTGKITHSLTINAFYFYQKLQC